MAKAEDLLVDLQERIKGLEQQAELIKTVLIVKEPSTVPSSQASAGLRRQVVTAAAERRSHPDRLVAMSAAEAGGGGLVCCIECPDAACLERLPDGARIISYIRHKTS